MILEPTYVEIEWLGKGQRTKEETEAEFAKAGHKLELDTWETTNDKWQEQGGTGLLEMPGLPPGWELSSLVACFGNYQITVDYGR